jgi:hypothetical protein
MFGEYDRDKRSDKYDYDPLLAFRQLENISH